MDDLIQWNKYFDHVYCIHCASYIERFRPMSEELRRVGINGDILTIYNPDTSKQFVDMYRNFRFNDKTFQRFSRFSIAYSHYQVIHNAVESRYDRILVLEDDIRFLKSINDISLILGEIPNDYGLILFDKFTTNHTQYKKIISENNCKYIKTNGFTIPFYSGACYSLNRETMILIRDMFDINLSIIDSIWNCGNIINSKLDRTINKYISRINMAIQGNYSSSNFSPWENLKRDYCGMGIDISSYNLIEEKK